MKLNLNFLNFSKKNKFFLALFLVILLFHQFIFQKFFPNSLGLLGHDYEYFMPNLMFGKVWFKYNFLSVPWFTPSFCCGIPFFADPETMFYSINQFIFLILDPITSLKVMFFLHAFVAYIGMYLLSNKNFKFNKYNSLLCASLFLFNGFFMYRAIPGHVGHLSYVFIPIYCYFLINSAESKLKNQRIIYLFLSSIIFANFFHSGSGSIMPIISASIFFVLSFYAHFFKKLKIFAYLFFSFFIGTLISLSKISAVLFFLKNYPRKYLATQFDSSFAYIKNFFLSFFLKPDKDYFNGNVKSMFPLEVHELEYGISIVPLLLLLFIFFIKKEKIKFNFYNIRFVFLIIFVFLVPFLFNVNIFNQFPLMQKIPILSSNWVQIRWMAVYILPIIIISGFIVENISFNSVNKKYLILILILVLLTQNFLKDKSWHLNDQRYSIKNTVDFSLFLKKGNRPSIKGPSVYMNEFDRPIATRHRNDFFYFTYSPILCYASVFGYGLDRLDGRKITFNSKKIYDNNSYMLYSSAFDEKDGRFMFFNPSCFLFPKENNCLPADTFKVSEKSKLTKFVNYEKFEFKQHRIQIFANYISLISFLICILYLTYSYFIYLLNLKRKD